MKLTSLLERLEYEVCQGSDDLEVTELINDSRKVKRRRCVCLYCRSSGRWT